MAKNPSFNYTNSTRNKIQADLSKTLTTKNLIETIKNHQIVATSNQPQISVQQANNQAQFNSRPFSSPNSSNSLHGVLGGIAKDNYNRIHAASYTASRQFSGTFGGQSQQYSMNVAPKTVGSFQASYSNVNNGLYSFTNSVQPFRASSSSLANPMMFGTMGVGTINNQQAISAARSAGEDKLTAALNNVAKKFEEAVRQNAVSAGGGAGGGGGNDGGGGIGDFLARMGRKDRLGFRGGLAGQLLQTGGQLVNIGAEAYLNYQRQTATAPVETYSNIAQLKGFQQQRFLRDFADFSPEAQVLRNKSLRYEQSDITSRIDKISKETSQKQDVAETQTAIKQSFEGIAKSIAGGIIAGAGTGAAIGAVTGPGAIATAGIGAVTGGLTALAGELATGFNNPALMRNQKIFGDLYLKNRTAFDTQTIMGNTQAMENAVIQNSQIDIAVQREYQKTLDPRLQAGRMGRRYDVFGGLNQLAGVFGYNTAKTDPLTGQVIDQSSQIQRMASELYEPGRAPKNFAQTLVAMGLQPGTAEAESLMMQFANTGGAGAGPIKPKNFQSLEKIRQMSESGRGPADLLLGQAGVLGRLSGGVSVDQNIKKLEEVLGRAVAVGMDNSELGSAFVQNVANMSAQMKTSDISGIAALVQKMQAAGGGQLTDFERMQRSVSGFDTQRQQNFGVKTYARENLANAVDKFVKSGVLSAEDAATTLSTASDFSSKDLSLLPDAAKKYSSAKNESARLAATKGLTRSARDYLLTLTPQKVKKMLEGGFFKEVENSQLAAALGTTTEDYEQNYTKKDMDTRIRKAREAQKFVGGSAGEFLDVEKLFGTKNLGVGKTVDPEKVKAQEAINATRSNQAASNTALAAGSQGGLTLGLKIGTASSEETQRRMLKEAGFTSKEAEDAALKVTQDYFSVKGTKSFKEATPEESKIIDKLTKTVEQSQGPKDVKTVAERGQGQVLDNAQASAIGTAFADAFFKRMGEKDPSFATKFLNSFNKNKTAEQ